MARTDEKPGVVEAESREERDEEFRPLDPDDPLDKYVVVRWPWGEAEDRWLEALTGEPQGRRRDARDSDL
jgi:hypothetical protein